MNRKNIITLSVAGIVLMALAIALRFYMEDCSTTPSDTIASDNTNETGSGISVNKLEKLTKEENEELLVVYKGMKENNPDFAGYLRIEGTELAYPVMYSPTEPERYLHKDIIGADSDDGLPFIDTRCDLDPDSDNIVIYGHNMKDGSMFASLISYQDKSYYEAHPVIRYDSVDEIREYQVMSVFYDRVYYTDETDVFKFYDFIDAKDKTDYDEAIGQYLKKSVYDTGVTAEYGDKLITLVTCAYHTENGRFVVVAKHI